MKHKQLKEITQTIQENHTTFKKASHHKGSIYVGGRNKGGWVGEGGGTPPEIMWLLLYIDGRAGCVSCLGLVVVVGFVGLSGCGGVVGRC